MDLSSATLELSGDTVTGPSRHLHPNQSHCPLPTAQPARQEMCGPPPVSPKQWLSASLLRTTAAICARVIAWITSNDAHTSILQLSCSVITWMRLGTISWQRWVGADGQWQARAHSS